MRRWTDRLLRRIVPLLAASVCACVMITADGCVLAEPSGDLPRLPPTRPTIVRGSVVPSASLVLATFPEVFIVPVELADPTQPFEYAAFIDYNSFTGEGLAVPPTQSVYEPSNTAGRVRLLTIPVNPPTEIDRCHVIEIVVALRLESNKSSQTAHTPAEPGGDIVTWFYNPSGDVGGCPATDAGIDARAASEAGEGGVQ